MPARRRVHAPALVAALVIIAATIPAAQTTSTVTSPKAFFGFNIGDDYQLATYTKYVDYLHKIEKETNRMKVEEIGKTSEGRPMVIAIVTSPENMKRLNHYREISSRLAHAEGLTDDQAHALAKEGKSVVLIDGGLHATEVLGAQQIIENVWEMVSRADPETMRLLNDDIVIYVEMNPDGMDLVSNWYMRHTDPQQRTINGVPVLYQKYAGHDDNRDSYMSNLPEITNVNHVMFLEWYPQIVYDNHQTGPAGTVMFAPPFRDPFNYNFDPQVPVELELVAAAMHSRFVAEGKPGVTERKGAPYSTWFNGGQRTVTYFHNMVGLLTETIGNPTPMQIPFIPSKQLPDSNLYDPIEPQQVWHFRQSVDYSMTSSRAVMDIASRERENLLYNFYQMGRNSIERGSRDSWTTTYHRVTAAEAVVDGQGTLEQFKQLLRNPAQRDPRGFIVPSDQPDFPTATKFINTLIKTGITIERATTAFSVAGKNYPAGSWVVKSAQAFRPHVLDMFEPQDHPDDIPYPGGPPTPPYDATGYTLAFQMGVKFDRIMDGFDGPFEKVTGLQKPLTGTVNGANGPVVFSHENTNSFIAANRLVAAGHDVEWLKNPGGAFMVTGASHDELQKLATDLGVSFKSAAGGSTADALKLRKLRIGLVDQYGGSMPSGWTRYIFEQFEFPYQLVFPKALDAGNLISKYDVIVFPSGTFPAVLATAGGGGRGGRGGAGGRAGGAGRGGRGGNAAAAPDAGAAGLAQRGGGGRGFGGPPADLPAEYQDRVGNITAQTTMPQLRKFLEDGGTIVAVGQSAALAQALGLPVENYLAERTADGTEVPLPREKFYVPGSILRMAVDNTQPAAQGAADHVDVFFDNNQVFALAPDAALKGVRPVAWFDTGAPLRSGWAWGQGYLKGGVTAIDATVGKGHLYAWTPEITFRAQPHGTFKFLFNAIYLAAQKPAGQ